MRNIVSALSMLAVFGTTLAALAAPAVPQKPVTRSGDRSVVVHWNQNTDTETTGYRVYRATSIAGPYQELTSSNAAELSGYADCSVSNNRRYFYYVRAQNAQQELSASSDTVDAAPQSFASDEAFLDYVEQTAFDYFWYEANPSNGLVKDRSTRGSSSSIAATGFGLTAIGIGIDRGWITRQEGRERTMAALSTFWQGPQSVLPSGMIGYRGWFYHFLDMKNAVRAGTSELSSIDTGLLLAGILFSKQYFEGSDTTEVRIRALADSIIRRVDWNWMRNNGSTLTMGWNPGSGFINARWTGYNEAMILYILGIGAPSAPLPSSSWSAWTSTYQWFFNTWLGDYFVQFPPLFGHQYSHCWVDFRAIADGYMKSKGITYFENSRRATLAQRLYCIDNPRGATGYGPNVWGITASDVPTGYAARGTNYNDDGTINPTAPGGSMPFAPEFCLPALKTMYELYREKIWTPYGFSDAFNLSVTPAWFDPAVLGIDQGPIVIMIENYRTGSVWNRFMKEKIVADGLARAGFTSVTSVEDRDGALAPHAYRLEQNYPNPFNPATEIRFHLGAQARVILSISNVLGEEVSRPIDGVLASGAHQVSVDAGKWASGVYFYTLKAGAFTQTRRMLLLR
ncbi:MAG: glucoamylase family protein [Acidobacteriota bacterium]